MATPTMTLFLTAVSKLPEFTTLVNQDLQGVCIKYAFYNRLKTVKMLLDRPIVLPFIHDLNIRSPISISPQVNTFRPSQVLKQRRSLCLIYLLQIYERDSKPIFAVLWRSSNICCETKNSRLIGSFQSEARAGLFETKCLL